MDWMIENGSIIEDVDFPVAFGNIGYTGVAANKDIPPNKCFVAIPNKLLISTILVDKSELGDIMKLYPVLFLDFSNLGHF
jgi:hypothetical protein